MKVFDLHSHPGFKTIFKDCWDDPSFKTIFKDCYTAWDEIPVHPRFLVGKILQSQSNLAQIISNPDCNLICVSLYPPETELVGNWLIRFAGPRITDGFDRARLNEMSNKTFTYKDGLEKALHNLHLPPPQKKLHILRDFNGEYDSKDFTTLYILFSIEGGHSFYGKKNDDTKIDLVLRDFSALVKSGIVIFYITPCHLTPNIFMTHAYGNKLLARGAFIPRGKGITENGKKFLERIISEGLLIDVKHMSLVSRREFYKCRGYEKPILCSHTGVTGISWTDKLNHNQSFRSAKEARDFVKVRYIKPQGILTNTFFNPCSINLYNEDIAYILKSGGLIGISMDLRIIGGERNIVGALKLNEKEYVSRPEFEVWQEERPADQKSVGNFFQPPYPGYDGIINDEIWDEEDLQDEYEETNTLTVEVVQSLFSSSTLGEKLKYFFTREREDDHLRYFVNQVFHIVDVGNSLSPPVNAWEHICIGSDFDGLIRSIDCCPNAGELGHFADLLIKKLPKLAREKTYKLPATPGQLVEDIFYNNCFRVMQAHFPKKEGQTT